MPQSRIPIFLQQATMQRMRECLALANRAFGLNCPEPVISYRQRGTTAGCAHLQKWQITLNAKLLLENQQAFIDEVVPHEMAHLFAYRQFGRVSPHGKAWRNIMEQIFSVPANRTHRFDITSVQGKTFTYQCDCQKHQLTLRRHNKVVRGQLTYYCTKCQGRLIRVETENANPENLPSRTAK